MNTYEKIKELIELGHRVAVKNNELLKMVRRQITNMKEKIEITNEPIIYTASGCVRKTRGGIIMSCRDYVEMFAVPFELETKIGKRTAFLLNDPQELPNNVKDLIFDEFYPVALSAFNQNKSENFEKDVYKHLFDVDGLVLFFNDGVDYGGSHQVERGIAFRTYSMLDSETMYVEGTAVDPNYQSLGFYQAVTKATTNGSKYVVSRTQNPVVITALNRVFGNVADITREGTDKDKEVAWKLAQKLKMELTDGFYGKGTYGSRLNGMLPRIDNDIKKTLYSRIDPNNGDCVIAVCEVA